MKFLLTMLLAVMAIASFAVEYKVADMPDYKTNPEGFLAYWKTVTSPAIKMARKVRVIVQWESKLGQLEKTVPAIDARIAELAVENKLTADEVVFAKVYNYFNSGLTKESLALAEANITIPAVKNYIGWCYGRVGDYTKAVKLGSASCKIMYIGKLSDVPLKYNTCVSLLLAKRLSVAQANRIFNILTDIDLDEAEVSEVDYKKMLKKLKRKYAKTVKTTVDGVTKREYVYEDMRATIIDLLKDL